MIKTQEDEVINSLKNKDNSQTTTQEETLSRAQEHYQELFTPRQRPPNKEPAKIPNIGKSRSLIKAFSLPTVKKALSKLKSKKASGPDGIPNEALKLGAKEISPPLRKAFNLLLLTGESIPAWAEGIMYLIYKGKGDITDLNNYRGITVNNSISKLFASLLNDRLSKLVEKRGVLGQVQNGGRGNRQGLDSIFILRTILEKGLGKGKTAHKDLSLLFLDLAKAFDKVPHDLLWEKLYRMGFHPSFLKILKSLYKDTYVKVMINGWASEKVFTRSGVKQGCPLSPLLWALFISDIGLLLEQSPGGVLIWGQRISALLFVDDMVIIGRNKAEIKRIIIQCQFQFELSGLEINFSKSKILSRHDMEQDNMTITSQMGVTIGDLECKEKYKYLGVTLNMGARSSDIFKFQRDTLVSRLKSYAGLILLMAKESFDPIEVGEAMWKSMALEAVLYGIQTISVSEQILTKLDYIQAKFAADLLQVNRSCSHVGLLRELGWVSISSIVAKRKLVYWTRLCSLNEDNWARKAVEDCLSANYPAQRKISITNIIFFKLMIQILLNIFPNLI